MATLLKKGSMTRQEIAEQVDAKPDTIKRIANRHKELFIVLDGGKVGLLQKAFK